MGPIVSRTIVPATVAVACSCYAVSVDLTNSEVQAAVLILAVSGFVIGAIWPAAAWRWALILGLSIFVGDNFAPRLGLVSHPVSAMNWGTLIALIPAFVGTYVGVGVRAMIGHASANA